MSLRFGIRRCLPGVAALVVALGLAGCRHEQPRASAPPPPPAIGTGAPVVRRPPTAPPAQPEITGTERPFTTEVGVASWYGTSGRRAANGEAYDQDALTAASRTLPLGTIARVTNLITGQAVVVRITDRGPFVPGRVLDLSLGAAKVNGVYRMGIAKVRIEAFLAVGVNPGPGHWCVQVGAFSDPDDATQLKNDFLRRFGSTAKVITFKGDTGSWVRLTLADPDRDKAEQAAAQVRIPDPGVQAYVTRTN